MYRDFIQLGKEVVIYGITSALTRFMNILLVPVLGRMLLPEEYGIYGLLAVTAGLVSILQGLGLDSAVGRWFYDTEVKNDRAVTVGTWFYTQIVVSLIVAGIFLVEAEPLALLITGDAGNTPLLRLIGLTLPGAGLVTIIGNLFRLERRAKQNAAFSAFAAFVSVSVVIGFLLATPNRIMGVFIGQVAASVINGSAALFLIVRNEYLGALDLQRLRLMLRFSIPLIPAAFSAWIVGFADRFFLKHFVSTWDVGIYQVGSSIAVVVGLLTSAFQLAWGPFALSIHKEERAKKIYANAMLLYIGVACLVASVLAIWAVPIVSFVASKAYADAGKVVAILAFTHVSVGLMYIANTGLFIKKRSLSTAGAMIAAAAINIGLNFILVPAYGKTGGALSTLVSQSIIPLYLFYASHKVYPIPYPFVRGVLLAAGSFVAAVSLNLYARGSLALMVLGGAAIAAVLGIAIWKTLLILRRESAALQPSSSSSSA